MRLEPLGPALGHFPIVGQGRIVRQTAKHPIDDVDHVLARAVAGGQRLLANAVELAVYGVEQLRHAAPPAVDGLFDIADAKEAPLRVPIAAGRRKGRDTPHWASEVSWNSSTSRCEIDVSSRQAASSSNPVANPPASRRGKSSNRNPPREFQPLVGLPIGRKQSITGFGLIGHPADEQAPGMLDERAVKIGQRGIDRLAAVQGFALHQLARDARAHEGFPVLGVGSLESSRTALACCPGGGSGRPAPARPVRALRA